MAIATWADSSMYSDSIWRTGSHSRRKRRALADRSRNGPRHAISTAASSTDFWFADAVLDWNGRLPESVERGEREPLVHHPVPGRKLVRERLAQRSANLFER